MFLISVQNKTSFVSLRCRISGGYKNITQKKDEDSNTNINTFSSTIRSKLVFYYTLRLTF